MSKFIVMIALSVIAASAPPALAGVAEAAASSTAATTASWTCDTGTWVGP